MTGAHPDNTPQTGDKGDVGSKGKDGFSNSASSDGLKGTIKVSGGSSGDIKHSCFTMTTLGLSSAFDVARIQLIEKAYDDGTSLVEEGLAIAFQCYLSSIDHSNLWYNVLSEGVLLMNKFEQERAAHYRSNSLVVPSLSPDLYKQHIKGLLTTESTVRKLMKDFKAGSDSTEMQQCQQGDHVAAMQRSIKDLESSFTGYQTMTEQYDIKFAQSTKELERYELDVSLSMGALESQIQATENAKVITAKKTNLIR